MQVETFSVVVGTNACNALCPYCVARMTGVGMVSARIETPNWRNLRIACQMAQASRVTDTILASKGEPTLYPQQITAYLKHLAPYGLGIIQIQTNALLLGQRWDIYEAYLRQWHKLGLSTIAISTVHYDPARNAEVYLGGKKPYFDLPNLIGRLHKIGYTVRIVCTLVKGWVDSVEEMQSEIAFAQAAKVDQLTLRPVTLSYTPANAPGVFQWTQEHLVAEAVVHTMRDGLQADSHFSKPFGNYGAMWFDVGGLSVMLSNCLTMDKTANQDRQLIFWADGTITTDWQSHGSVLLAGRNYHQDQV